MKSLGPVPRYSDSISGVESREYIWFYNSWVTNDSDGVLALRIIRLENLKGIPGSNMLYFYHLLSLSIHSLEPVIVWDFLHYIGFFCLFVSSSLPVLLSGAELCLPCIFMYCLNLGEVGHAAGAQYVWMSEWKYNTDNIFLKYIKRGLSVQISLPYCC